MKVVMFVYNDATFDSRVLREAATLADAGHEVTLMATLRATEGGPPEHERRDGFEIVRVPIPHDWWSWWRRIVNPTTERERAGRLWHKSTRFRSFDMRGAIEGGRGIVSNGTLLRLRRWWLSSRERGRTREAGGEASWPPETVSWLASWRWSIHAWAMAAAAAAPLADVYHGHDLTGLPAARAAARRNGGRVVYDSHEIYVESGRAATRPGPVKRLLRFLEWRWSRGIVALVSVNDAYASVIGKRIHPRRTVVVHNCPPRWEPPLEARAEPPRAASPREAMLEPPQSPADPSLEPPIDSRAEPRPEPRPEPARSPDRLREAAGIPSEAPVVLYHGALTAHRGLSELAASMLEPGLESAHLVYLGYGASRSEVEGLVADERFGARLHILDAVPPDVLLEWIATADVDAIPLQHSTLNHYLCTPNKLFESIAAGVPVVVSDFPVMRRITLDDAAGPLGAVCEPSDPVSIARAIRSLLALAPDARAELRQRCLQAAHERWNWETESAKLVRLYGELAGRPSSAGAEPDAADAGDAYDGTTPAT